jgi:hypothetical protein
VVLLLVSGFAVIAVGMIAVHDHHRSRTRMFRAEEAEWYCRYRHERCGGPESKGLHEAWERREARYKVAEGALSAAVVIAGGVTLLRRRSTAVRRSQSPAS